MIHDLHKNASEIHFDKNISGMSASNVQGAIDELKGTIGYTKKNELPNNLTTQTINGITFTLNADKSVRIKGTASAQVEVTLVTPSSQEFKLNKRNYIMSGCSGGSSDTYFLYLYKSGVQTIYQYDKDTILNIQDEGYYGVGIRVRSGQTVDTTIYPMIRDARITDGTYEPYVPSLNDIMTYKDISNDITVSDAITLRSKLAYVKNGVVHISLHFSTANTGAIELFTISEKYRPFNRVAGVTIPNTAVTQDWGKIINPTIEPSGLAGTYMKSALSGNSYVQFTYVI